jgi:hypothetical protein
MLSAHHTGIADSSSNEHYFAPNAPVANYNPQAPTVGVCMANCCPKHLVASATLAFQLLYFEQLCWGMSCLPSPIPSSAWACLPTKNAQSSLHKQQSKSITQTAIQFSQTGRMRLVRISGIFLSPPRLLTPRMRPVPQLLDRPSERLLRFLHHHPVSQTAPTIPSGHLPRCYLIHSGTG